MLSYHTIALREVSPLLPAVSTNMTEYRSRHRPPVYSLPYRESANVVSHVHTKANAIYTMTGISRFAGGAKATTRRRVRRFYFMLNIRNIVLVNVIRETCA